MNRGPSTADLRVLDLLWHSCGCVHVGMHRPQYQRQISELQGTAAVFCIPRDKMFSEWTDVWTKLTIEYLHIQIRRVVDSSQLLHSESSNQFKA